MKVRLAAVAARADSVVEGESFLAYLFSPKALPSAGGFWWIGIARVGDRTGWEGWAMIPWEDFARRRLADLETDTDVEDLLREWGADELAKGEFGSFVARNA